MARRRKTNTRRRRRAVSRTRVTNPRRRRHTRRRRHNPGFVARTARRTNPRRRRHARRRHNPSGLRIGQLAKDAIYGAGGAILTRAGTQIVTGFVPQIAGLGGSYAEPLIQAGVAATAVRWVGKKFLGQSQGDVMMIGGLISAGLALADRVLPNLQGQIVGLVPGRQALMPAANAALPAAGAGMGDVYDVDMQAAGFGDVEDVDMAQFNGVPLGL